MDVLPEKTIIDKVIKRCRRVNGYKDVKNEREMVEIAKRETVQRKKIKDDTRRILEVMSKTKNDPNMEQPMRDYDGLYMEESELAFVDEILRNQMTTLHNHELVFQNQKALVRIIHRMERMMCKKNRHHGVAEVPVPSTRMRLPLSSNLDVLTFPNQEYHLYDPIMNYHS
ncbi:hypothetical protein Syun_025546 [Stephania yunnanensis]|uniref:Uncharacterized protein n=1 Tax=Stephania yunnanensis TaxID=152371 RepID=A0AAP0ESG6_9MAGN